jgi:hypothetical protein
LPKKPIKSERKKLGVDLAEAIKLSQEIIAHKLKEKELESDKYLKLNTVHLKEKSSRAALFFFYSLQF